MFFRTLFFFVCFLVVVNLDAQSTSFGVHLISNLSSFQEPKTLSIVGDLFEYKFGYGIGGNVTKNIGKHFDVRAELNFERKGAKYDLIFTDENGNPTSDSKPKKHLDYISLPLLLQMKFGEKVGFNFQVGTSFHFLFRQKIDIGIKGEINDIYQELDNIDKYNRFDQSVLGGVGFYAQLNEKLMLYLNGRMAYGLNEVSEDEYILYVDKNIAYMLMAGVQF